MTSPTSPAPHRRSNRVNTGVLVRVGVAVVVLVAIVLGTKVVHDSNATAATGAFSAATFGKQNFTKVQAAIDKRAVDASVLATALKTDQAAAVKKYGEDVEGAVGPELCVKFTGTVGTGESGIVPVKVTGLPSTLLIRIQTGPAINGTDLRDGSGLFDFGNFTNQIDFQNAAAALNNQLKTTVLSKVATGSLTGKTVSVVGAFQLINPNGWLVTPAKLSVS